MKIELVAKIFGFSLPTTTGNNCILLKDESRFIEEVLNLPGCHEVTGPDFTGTYHVVMEETELSDKEVMSRITEIIEKIGFEEGF